MSHTIASKSDPRIRTLFLPIGIAYSTCPLTGVMRGPVKIAPPLAALPKGWKELRMAWMANDVPAVISGS